ncbi:hypothetical protein V1506DRAFT_200510 [Lipomyces tetrasporus]
MSYSIRKLQTLQALRFAQVVLSIGSLSTTSISLSSSRRATADWAPSDYKNGAYYLISVSVWTLLVQPFLIWATAFASPTATTTHKLAVFAVDLVTNIMLFTGLMVMAFIYSPWICSPYGDEYDYSYDYSYGYSSSIYDGDQTPCVTSKVAIAFSAINWFLFVITIMLLGTMFFRRQSVNFGSEPGAGASYVPAGAVANITTSTHMNMLFSNPRHSSGLATGAGYVGGGTAGDRNMIMCVRPPPVTLSSGSADLNPPPHYGTGDIPAYPDTFAAGGFMDSSGNGGFSDSSGGGGHSDSSGGGGHSDSGGSSSSGSGSSSSN